MPLFSPAPVFTWSANAEGLAIRFARPKQHAKAKLGQANEEAQLGLIRMEMLAESGRAEVREIDAGIFVAAADAARLDLLTREGFQLPPPWPGGLRLRTESVPQSPTFTARIGLVDPGATVRWEWHLRGPILETGGANYLPTTAQYAALRAFQTWRETADARGELTNLSLLATLREAREEGCHIDLEAYRETLVAHARELSVDARPEKGTGDLILRPVLTRDFPDLDAARIEACLGQLAGVKPQAVMRVGQTIVLLDPQQTRQARALVERGRVPREEVSAFQLDPAAWLSEHVFPDIETEFSPRVTGVGVWKEGYAGALWSEGEDWFGKKPQPERRAAAGSALDGGRIKETIDPPVDDDGGRVVPIILANDTDLGFGQRTLEREEDTAEPDFSRYARPPLDHQRQAVVWLLRHGRRALRRREPRDEGPVVSAGALLADDMGLGKTFSTLIFLREWLDLWRAETHREPPAVLIVAPLSLLENWKVEIAKGYGEGNTVFRRVLIAQSDEELNLVRRRPGSRDKAVPGRVLEYGLGFGDGTTRSLDYPGGCVLTTYQTLRDYRFSFAKAEWSAVIFDEAQNIKDPNALQTIAAKSLKALFRLTLTGTPVRTISVISGPFSMPRNRGRSVRFAEFRQRWILPMTREPDRQGEIGLRLREHVGDLMLRRMKEDALTGLPGKSGHDHSIPVALTAEQLAAYDAVVVGAQGGDVYTESNPARQNQQLAALWQLRQISLHPDLLAGGTIGAAVNARESRALLQRSGKLAWLLLRLDEIRSRGEKALLFCLQKKIAGSPRQPSRDHFRPACPRY